MSYSRNRDSFYESIYKEGKPFFKHLKKREITEYFKKYLSGPIGSYTKVPMVWNGYLWAVSPFYGLSDYNKSRMIEVKGNEDFVNKIMAYAKKRVAVK